MIKHYRKIRSDPLRLILTILQALIGAWITAIGAFLFSDQHYFFWPPDWSNIENDIRLDTAIVIIGLLLFLCTIFGITRRKIIATLLVLCGAISLAMAALSALHVIMSGYYVMGLNIIGELVLFSLILLVAHYLQEVGRLQDLSNLILAIAALIGSLTTLYQVIMKNKRNIPPSDDIDIAHTEKKIEELQKKLDQERKNKK